MKQRNHLPILIALTGIFLAGSVDGQLFVDDFESYPAGSTINTSGPWTLAGIFTAEITILDETTATPFGTPNKFLNFNDNDDSSVRLQSANFPKASNAITTFVLDFNEPSSGGNTRMIIGYAITNGDLNDSGSRLGLTLNDGNIIGLTGGTSIYDLDTSYRLYVVFNDTAEAVSYNGGSNSVPAGTADVWIEPSTGPAVFAGNRVATNSQTASYGVGLRCFSTDQQQVLIDNVTLFEGVALPGNPPILVNTSPVDDELAAPVATDLVATFNVPVFPGSGNLIVKELVGDATVFSLPMDDSAVSFSGSSITVDLPNDLALGVEYYVLIEAGAITDSTGAPFAGIVAPDTSTWNFKTGIPPVVALQTSTDAIRGRSQANPLIYIPNSTSGQVGIGGPGGGRNDFNVILGFTLPTLPVGETVTAATLNFEIRESRDTGNNPALHVYLVDEKNPESTGVDFFYHGPADPNEKTKFVGAVNLEESGTGNNVWADDEQDQSIALTGEALALLQSFYGGGNVPDRTEAFFRFNLDQLLGGATINNFERYFIDTASDESVLTLVSGVASPYDTWAAGFTPNPGSATDNPDADTLDNLLEFAFGTDPNVIDALPLVADGSVNGLPIARSSGGAVNFVFVRRDDFGTSGSVTYTPQFSDDLVTFFDSTTTPIFVADSTDDAAYEVVSVTYPLVLPNGKEARYGRLKVEIAP